MIGTILFAFLTNRVDFVQIGSCDIYIPAVFPCICDTIASQQIPFRLSLSKEISDTAANSQAIFSNNIHQGQDT